MKARISWLSAITLAWVSVGLLSCQKENLNGISSRNDPTAIFSADIDGIAWKTDSVSAFLVGPSRGKPKMMTITGYTSNRVISISLCDTSGGGSDSTMAVQVYPLLDWARASAFAYGYNRIQWGPTLTWQQQGEGVMGEAAVTVCDGEDKLISGTFGFSASVLVLDNTSPGTGGIHTTDSVKVTNGVFKHIPYSYLKHP